MLKLSVFVRLLKLSSLSLIGRIGSANVHPLAAAGTTSDRVLKKTPFEGVFPTGPCVAPDGAFPATRRQRVIIDHPARESINARKKLSRELAHHVPRVAVLRELREPRALEAAAPALPHTAQLSVGIVAMPEACWTSDRLAAEVDH